MRKPWFRRKKTSWCWCWMPVRWEGWVIVLLYGIVIAWLFITVDRVSHSVSDTLINVAPRFVLFSLVFIFIAYRTEQN